MPDRSAKRAKHLYGFSPELPMKNRPTFTIGDILTDAEINRAVQLYEDDTMALTFNRRVVEEIVMPNLKRIEEKLGQPMDPRYLGYAIEYALMHASR